ncbi:hypothetical protein Slin15195_G059920 [Septoria linicola]|uniref:Uncharacterized protein n=1 Tax=Septoria linicola TaxID=215465 RepID=A0A9Q9AT26_9PEZI|nr:hypothetical protein Slin14017_G075770 [Septoria linicola]USW52673.1 hypothetical protein Slin15195_G059920 [Septoria linicola]
MANTTAGQTASNSKNDKGKQAIAHGPKNDDKRHDSMIPPEDRAIAVDSPVPQARDPGSTEFDPLSSSNKFINGTERRQASCIRTQRAVYQYGK